MNTFGAGDELVCASDKLFSAEDECIEIVSWKFNPLSTHTLLATSEFQVELILRWLPLTSTHLWIRAVAITLLYSRPSTLHPQVIYAVAFSAGLSGIQVN